MLGGFVWWQKIIVWSSWTKWTKVVLMTLYGQQLKFMNAFMDTHATLLHCDQWTTAVTGIKDDTMMTSSNGKSFRITGPLCGEFTGHRWIPLTKASHAELWCLFLSARLYKRLSKQSWGWWFETPSRSLWRHCNAYTSVEFRSNYSKSHRQISDWPIKKHHHMFTSWHGNIPLHWPFVRGIYRSPMESPHKRLGFRKFWYLLCC